MILLLIASAAYSAFLIGVLSGVLRLSYHQKKGMSEVELPSVDVLVPYRNESDRIAPLLKSLQLQTYPLEKVRYIFVNDHSYDNSSELVSDFSKKTRSSVLMLDLPDGLEGKKSALELGLIHVTSDFVLFTDADCVPHSSWIKALLGFATRKGADMVLGPVEMTGNNFPSRFQSAEFLSLQAVTIGTAGLGNAVLSNAANMLIRSDLLKAMDNPFQRELSSGDDVFLMEQMKRSKHRIGFCLQHEALVCTPASKSWQELLVQRARWLSKTKKYSLNFSLLFAGTFGFLQFLYLFVFVLLLVKSEFLILCLFVLHKLIFDFLLMGQTALKTGSRFHFLHSLLLSFTYPLWTIISSSLAFIIRPKWKDRPVKV